MIVSYVLILASKPAEANPVSLPRVYIQKQNSRKCRHIHQHPYSQQRLSSSIILTHRKLHQGDSRVCRAVKTQIFSIVVTQCPHIFKKIDGSHSMTPSDLAPKGIFFFNFSSKLVIQMNLCIIIRLK